MHLRSKFFLLALFACCFFQAFSQTESDRIYLLPTIHGLHKANPNYTYDHLKSLIDSLNPDIIAVEIRPEDLLSDTLYLKKNYPYEMYRMPYWFPEKEIAGIDWLGEDIEGMKIPENYWHEVSDVKELERKLAVDSSMSEKRNWCNSFIEQRIPLLKNLSLKDLLKSENNSLTEQQYQCFEEAYKGTAYEKLVSFYEKRNQKQLENLKRLVTEYKSSTIVVLVGDDHYAYLKERIKHQILFRE